MLDERYLSHLPSDRNRLVRAAQRLLGATAEAEDVVQESYLRAVEAGAGGAPPPDAAQAWLTTVMQNLVIDRLRRRDWMRRWLHDAEARASALSACSAEDLAAQAEESTRALRLLAATLSAADGAALLLREVFEASYADIARASGRSEAGCRQQVHRALMRLRQRGSKAPAPEDAAGEADTSATFGLYLQSLRNRDLQPLLGLLRQAATRAMANSGSGVGKAVRHCEPGPATAVPRARCEIAQIGGRLGLVLALGTQFVCVLPLGARSESDHEEQATVAG